MQTGQARYRHQRLFSFRKLCGRACFGRYFPNLCDIVILQNAMDIWKTVYTVKKILLISVLFLLTSLPLSAEKLSEVSLRQGVQDNNVRIVVESDEDFIRNSNVKFSSSAVIVEFPSRF